MSELLIKNKKLMLEYNYEKNKNLKLDSLTVGSSKKIWWICNKGHEWNAAINHRYRGQGCPVCANRAVLKGYNDLATTHPELASEWDYENNNGVTPSDIVAGSNKKFSWICEKGHKWETSPNSRNSGQGCPVCANQKVLEGYNDLATTHPELASEWDYEKNYPLTPKDIIAGSTKKVWWKCKNNHHYECSVVNRKTGKGCSVCANKIVVDGINDLATINPELASEWNYEKNYPLTPRDVIAGSTKKVWWKCKRGHEWKASIVSRNRNHFCPKCDLSKHSSISEKAIVYYLKKSNIRVVENYKLFGKEVDVFIPSLGVAIEYDGQRFHKNVERDLNKSLFLKSKNVNLIRIREPELPHLNNGDKEIYISKLTSDYSYLNEPINELFSYLNLLPIDINTDRDLNKIYDLFQTSEKGIPLFVEFPELEKEWDYEKNEIDPEKVSRGLHLRVWWICSTCGHSWKTPIYVRTQGSGCPKCGFVKTSDSKKRKVKQYDLNGKYLKTFNSIKEAEMETGAKNIFYVCVGKRKKSGGFIWKYE